MGERPIGYEALKTAREMAGVETRETLRRLHNHYLRQKSDQRCDVPLGFKYIDVAPHDGTFIRLQFNPLRVLNLQHEEMIGRFEIKDDGFFGWFDRDDNYLPWPLFWAPIEGSVS